MSEKHNKYCYVMYYQLQVNITMELLIKDN